MKNHQALKGLFAFLAACALVGGVIFFFRTSPRDIDRDREDSTQTLDAPPTRPTQPHSPWVRPALSPQPRVLSTPPIPPEARKFIPVARAVCQSPALSAFADQTRDCTEQAFELRSTLLSRINQYTEQGETINFTNCVATSPDGATSSSESVGEDFFELSGEIASRGLTFDFDRDISPRRLNRMRLVALCNIQKTADYWAEHPEQIPQGSDLEDSLAFDERRGEPRTSRWIGSFIRIMARLHERR